ncbi:hypothetical protein PYCCODRAFT_1379054 [Trametes coccinea BRFM310]|uniref:Uncharacterized protein n=1 Tax=Trametes coccinea (strain BRFM310) TaxID=1353009 RepID=A0A1Y2I5U6_TRAC3|nr:hypothetical protein PYCCODRAFT_1379054 [Trametes coccinea BRFM310]
MGECFHEGGAVVRYNLAERSPTTENVLEEPVGDRLGVLVPNCSGFDVGGERAASLEEVPHTARLGEIHRIRVHAREQWRGHFDCWGQAHKA